MSGALDQVDDVTQIKQSLLALKKMRSKLDSIERAKTEPIAVIGMACRFPGGANDPESFWQILRDGIDTVTEVPADRWNVDDYYDPNPDAPGKSYARHGAFINGDVRGFDADFFGISAPEAESMDPQQRLLLELAWEALERAGQSPAKLAGSETGVFIGLSSDDFSKIHLTGNPAAINAFSGSGSHFSVAVGRICYLLGLQGPNFPLDTACSSSLVTTHIACQSLRRGECRVAMAGGVNLILWPQGTLYFSRLRALAPDGRCKTFDAAADGYVRGEGCGILVLKRLSDAQADGDEILALIKGSAINHNGRSNGLTAPNGTAQKAVIQQALFNAGVDPSLVSYVEAHGTATALGDLVEIEAMTAVIGEKRSPNERFAIGSVKTNIGHLEAAAGVAALIKVILSLQHKEIPPHLHLKTRNRDVPWDAIPVFIPTDRTPWISEKGKRVAGVSAFSYSGTNAHVLVEEAPEREVLSSVVERPVHLLCVSAKNPEALEELAGRYVDYLGGCGGEESLADICFTANSGRMHFKHRIAVTASTVGEAREKLAGTRLADIPPSGRPKIALWLTGENTQYPEMGRELYETQPTFRKALEECKGIGRRSADGGPSPLFALEYALWQLWRSWGIGAGAVFGHGVGEYVAGCVTGKYPLEDALRLAAEGRAAEQLKHIEVAAGYDIVLQVGPPEPNPAGSGIYLRSLCQGVDEWRQILDSLATLYSYGVEIDWAGFDRDYKRRRLTLPTYTFQRKPYWPAQSQRAPAETYSLIRRKMQSPLVKEIVFESEFSTSWRLLADHCAYGTAVVPAAVFLAMLLVAAESVFGQARCAVANAMFTQPLLLPDKMARTVQLVMTPDEEGGASFKIISIAGTSWSEHVTGRLERVPAVETSRCDGQHVIQKLKARCARGRFDTQSFYKDVRDKGLQLGESFQWLREAWRGDAESLCRLRSHVGFDRVDQFQLHPGVIDACFQLLSAALPEEVEMDVYVPIGIDRFTYHGSSRGQLWAHARIRPVKDGYLEVLTGDTRLLDDQGTALADAAGIHLKRAPREALLHARAERTADCLYEIEWQPKPLAKQADSPTTGACLIFADTPAAASALARLLERQGVTCIIGDSACPDDYLADLRERARQIIEAWAEPGNAMVLCFVTKGVDLASSALRSLLAAEHPQLHCQSIDLDPVADVVSQSDLLVEELHASDGQDRVAFRDGLRLAPRLVQRAPTNLTIPERKPFRLEIGARGVLENLTLRALERKDLGPQEVEIQVSATGLNFRDVLNALDMYPGEAGPLGGECAGTIVALGEEVNDFQIGDEVIAVAPGSFSSSVTVPTTFVARKPRNLDFQEAATIPIAFMTAHYALEALARISQGDRILIHAAAGGVGMAALQVAQRAGAEIFATAGSAEKREFVRSMGVAHVFNSRSLEFAEEIRALTNGEGIDVVLNSLAGDFIPTSLSLLRRKGRFVEIGKSGVLVADEAARLKNNVSYFAFDLGEIASRDPELIRGMLLGLVERFEKGELTPLPRRDFAIEDAVSAFRFMSQAKHIGKIVVTGSRSSIQQRLLATALYVIYDGNGQFGIPIAHWMAQRGASHLRVIRPGGYSETQIGRLRDSGATIESAEEARLSDIPNLRGVVYIPDPCVDEGIKSAWKLHTSTKERKLDFFIMLSPVSNASIMGDSFLDALVQHRQTLGLPGLSVAWAREDEPSSSVLDLLLSKSGQIVVQQAGRPPAPAKELLSPQQRAQFINRLAEVSAVEAREMVSSHVREQACKIRGVSSFSLDPRRPLNELGFDSLMAVELRNALVITFGKTLRATLVFDYPTLDAIAGYLADEFVVSQPTSTARFSADQPELDRMLTQIEELPEAEVEKSLMTKKARGLSRAVP